MTSGGTVRSIFNYTRDTGVEPEIFFYEPPHRVEPRRAGDDPREMTVHNGWARASLFSPDREGFALRDFRSSFQQLERTTGSATDSIEKLPSSSAERSAPNVCSFSITRSARRETSSRSERRRLRWRVNRNRGYTGRSCRHRSARGPERASARNGPCSNYLWSAVQLWRVTLSARREF